MLNTVFCHLRIHALQFLEFLLECLFHFLRPFFLCSFFSQNLDVDLVRRSAEFFLYGTKLLVKKIFALLLIHIHLHLALNLMFQFYHLHLVRQDGKKLCRKCRYVIYLEKSLFLRHRLHEVTCYEVNHEPRAVNIFQSERSLERKSSRFLCNLHREVFYRLYQSLELAVARNDETFTVWSDLTF